MNKQEFLAALSRKLNGLPEDDLQRSLDYYREMLADRTEEGLSEEEAVAALGSVEQIAAQILEANPGSRTKRRLSAWEIVLLILGAPLWLPLLIAAASIVLSAYIVIWSGVLVLYSLAVSLAATAFAGIVCALPLFCQGEVAVGLLYLGLGLIGAGLTAPAFWGCNCIAKGLVRLTGWVFRKLLRRESK